MTFVFYACANVTSGIFARVEVACGGTALVFSNAEKVEQKVVVRATDQCSGSDSEVQLVDAGGKVVTRFPVADGTMQIIHVAVPAGDWLNFVCAGTSGGCAYAVSGE